MCLILLPMLALSGSAIGAESAMMRRTLEHDGIEREYFVHVPDGFEGALPVVVAIHGYGSTATGFEAAHDLNRHADANGYIAVYPQGTHFPAPATWQGNARITSWNDLAANLGPTAAGPHCVDGAVEYPCPPECGTCDRCAWTACYDDVGFIDEMLDRVHAEFATDEQRTYLLGVSNGGMLALRLGCNLADRFAAVAPIIAQLAPGYACGPDVDVPMLHLYGGSDDTVRHDGKPGADGFIYTTAGETAAVWAAALACHDGPRPWRNEYADKAGLVCSAYRDCRIGGQEVVSCMDSGGGHDWPGQRVASVSPTCVTSLQAASMPEQARCPAQDRPRMTAGMDLVWDFFRGYSRAEVSERDK
jgi:polyhydroxybutyrate depolymerase